MVDTPQENSTNKKWGPFARNHVTLIIGFKDGMIERRGYSKFLLKSMGKDVLRYSLELLKRPEMDILVERSPVDVGGFFWLGSETLVQGKKNL